MRKTKDRRKNKGEQRFGPKPNKGMKNADRREKELAEEVDNLGLARKFK